MKVRVRGGVLLLCVLALTLGLIAAGLAAGTAALEPLQMLPASQIAVGTGHTARADALDINLATAEELDTLPGIGSVRAAAIVSWRENNGPFRYPEELILVPGIGEGILAGLLDRITVGGE